MTERERIGKRIAELRNEKGISQTTLASLSGLGQGHIARIELGQYNVGVDTLSKISDALGVKLELVTKIETEFTNQRGAKK